MVGLGRFGRSFFFPWTRKKLGEVMSDHDLASLGDAFVNLICSLALSNRKGQPMGIKVKGRVLAAALRKAGLRQELPSQMSTHTLADAAEALIVYAWLNNCISLEQSVEILTKEKDFVQGFARLLTAIKEELTFP